MGLSSAQVVVWSDAAHADRVGRLLDVMGSAITVLAVGGPRGAEVAGLAQAVGHEADDDLRHMLVTHPSAFLLLATHEPAATADLLAACTAGTMVLVLEPVADDLTSLAALEPVPLASPDEGGGEIIPTPQFVLSPGFVGAAEPFDEIGTARTLCFQSLGPGDQGSLLSRLLDAWRTVLAFTDLPETIDAQWHGPAGEKPSGLRALTGRITAHARGCGVAGVTDTASAVIHVCDTSGRTMRQLSVVGSQAVLRVDDHAYDLMNADGEPVDQTPAADRSVLSGVDLIAAQWRRLIERPATAKTDRQGYDRERQALACCLACLLSHRTGQPETPATLLKLT